MFYRAILIKCASNQTTSRFLRGSRILTSHQVSNKNIFQARQYSKGSGGSRASALTEARSREGSEVSTETTFETVKETTKTAGNFGVILIGVGICGAILYTIFRELFSSNSVNSIYSSSLDKCKSDHKVQDHLGLPIKAYGEENRRGRRRHVSHGFYQHEGRKHLFLQYYIEGSRKKGTVYVDMREDDNGNYQTNLLVVELDDLLRTKIIVEDNRDANSLQNSSPLTLY